ncbi:hypothetical protein [Streptomyces caatingaensis]|uniref:Uncharacterized protein n=1 Tax=Streptomyces caatingaensis TaxID=1678637 RepID=A0A0K9XHP8_9ACTN|nr:hypothetical protein [Streptomyces caatingaensis]KNB52924.1 hypothetical protein AC230_09900 [Streptomyces caatingaensis]
MPKRITGTDRVIMARFTARWPDGRCVLAYARHGSMAVVASVAVPGAPAADGSLWETAARHCPANPANEADAYGRWLLCAGWSMSVMPPAGGVTLSGERWSLEVLKTAVLKEPVYGSDGVHVGRLEFEDAAVPARLGELLG